MKMEVFGSEEEKEEEEGDQVPVRPMVVDIHGEEGDQVPVRPMEVEIHGGILGLSAAKSRSACIVFANSNLASNATPVDAYLLVV